MKDITNWRRASVADVESDGLLKEVTKIHCLSHQSYLFNGPETIVGDDPEELKGLLLHHAKLGIPIVFHNGISFDIPLLEKLLDIDLSKLMVIDTLILSWYLNPSRKKHGLDSFFPEYGIAKPAVVDWVNEPIEVYVDRCQEDVKINTCLWEDLRDRLIDMYTITKGHVDNGDVDGTRQSDDEVCYLDQYKNSSSVDDYIDRILTFLMYKMDNRRLKEKTRFKADRDLIVECSEDLSGRMEIAKLELESVMPKVAKYKPVNKPKQFRLQSGGLTVSGKRWNKYVGEFNKNIRDENGNELVKGVLGDGNKLKVLNKYEDPNINSSKQIKDWLFSKGWRPIEFKFVKDKEAYQKWADSKYKRELKPVDRPVPQITIDVDGGKELCPSVLVLAEKMPQIKVYADYNTIAHRYGIFKGWLEALSDDDHLIAGMKGLTNTLRIKHSEIANLPGVSKFYGDKVRGALIAEEGEVLLGSDMSGLEDRTKHHFMLPHDPEYVSTMMSDDYDPHILMALTANMITQAEMEAFKKGVKPARIQGIRHKAKQTNYSAVYGISVKRLAKALGVSEKEAKKLLDAYWELNWSVKKIAEDQCVFKDALGNKWLINPINGFCYALRKESDRFSTLNQGTGSFLFDMWLDKILTKMEEEWGYKKLSADFHDEFIESIPDNKEEREKMESITKSSIREVSEEYMLRRPLDCDVQFGKRYSEIH